MYVQDSSSHTVEAGPFPNQSLSWHTAQCLAKSQHSMNVCPACEQMSDHIMMQEPTGKQWFPRSLASPGGWALPQTCHVPQASVGTHKSAEWVKDNDCLWLPYRHVPRIHEKVHAQRLQFLGRQGPLFFPVECSLFTIPARIWHSDGLFSGGTGPREISLLYWQGF